MQRYVFDRQRLKAVAKANVNVKAAFLVVLIVFVLPGWVGSFGVSSNVLIDGILYETNTVSTSQTLFTTVLPLVLGYWATSYFIYAYVNLGETVNSLDVFKETKFEAYVQYIAKVVVSHVFIFLWSLLFVIPGVMKAYSYTLVPYLAVDRPELGILETLKESERLMRGYKADTFVLDLSFIGWEILNSFTLGILGFWLVPYKELAKTGLYFNIINTNTDYAEELFSEQF